MSDDEPPPELLEMDFADAMHEMSKRMFQNLIEGQRRWNAMMGIPEPTEYELSIWRQEHREADAKRHRELANDLEWLQALSERHPALAAVVHLHEPVDAYAGEWPVCDGCDIDGYEAERPGWPCRTIDALLGRLA